MPAGSQPVPESAWFKSSYSGGNTTECVQVAFTSSVVPIRHSKRLEYPPLAISAGAWTAFVAGSRRGH
ncbi:DUF397 domain-containing protein [Streptomyces coerulescens]|uniref:DUF397 domain-containing protein n=1 Tax=Streptomyces coerulescens TaxID=29304 RepID=A0ABW0CPD3_STRCD